MEPKQIEDFLGSGVWRVDADRPLTRKACVEILSRVPDELLHVLVGLKRVIVVAPSADRICPSETFRWENEFGVVGNECRIDGLTLPTTAQGDGKSLDIVVTEIRRCVLYLAPSLEHQTYERVLGSLVESITFAFLRVTSGNAVEFSNGPHGFQVAARSEIEQARHLGELWGFGRELASIYNKGKGGAGARAVN